MFAHSDSSTVGWVALVVCASGYVQPSYKACSAVRSLIPITGNCDVKALLIGLLIGLFTDSLYVMLT